MKIIKPQVELFPMSLPWRDMVAKAARVCYASEGGKRTSEEMCKFLQEKGHTSMFRHATHYYFVPSDKIEQFSNKAAMRLAASPYANIKTWRDKLSKNIAFFIAINGQFLLDNPKISQKIAPFEVYLVDYINKALELNFHYALRIIRYTVCVTTQISTSRELNRTSPNNIAEQSTRYVDFGKRGGITICRPHWYDKESKMRRFIARMMWKCGELAYYWFKRMGFPAQDARGFLPLDTATKVVYTYNFEEWQHILRLRLWGTTGKPHPNAVEVAQMIHDLLQDHLNSISAEHPLLQLKPDNID